MTEKMMVYSTGGEVANFFKKWYGKTIRCFGTCHKDRTMWTFKGYPHSGGLKDSDGDRWWVYFECPKCRYGHSFAKMDFFMQHTITEHEAEKNDG